MRIALSTLTLSCMISLSGCISTRIGSTTQQGNPLQGAALRGKVHGGEQAIVGASVYLFAANTTGSAGPGIPATGSDQSVSLLNSPGYVMTDSSGNFSISGDYTCPSANSQVYIYTVGGNPGLAQGTDNTSAGLLAGLGSCGSLKSSTVVIVNEVSTVATAYAIAGYATDALHVSSSGSALAQTGIANAFAAIPNLEQVVTTSGVTSYMGIANATTPAGNGTVPQAEINTLANILAACTNSTGAVTGPTNATPCYTLFTNAESAGSSGTQPTDTATAAINIAHNPQANVGTLYGLQTGTSPFQPTLSYTSGAQEFGIGVVYTLPGVHLLGNLAIDASGNVWTADGDNNTIIEFSPVGAEISPGAGFTGGGLAGPHRIAIDTNGNVWALNGSIVSPSISEFNSSGAPISGTAGYTGGGLSGAAGMAVDASGNVWMANKTGNSLSEFNSSGDAISSAPGYTGGGLNAPSSIAIDTGGNVWAADGNDYLSEFNSGGDAVPGSPYSGSGLDGPLGIAVDAAGDIWAINVSSTLSEFTSSGSPVNLGTFSGVSGPRDITADGDGDLWIADTSGFGAVEVSPSTSQTIAAYYGGIDAIAVDGSGNVWTSGGVTVVEFVGAAAPVVTPIVANLLPPYGQHAVNLP